MCSCCDKSNCTDIFLVLINTKTIETFSSVLRYIELPKLPLSHYLSGRISRGPNAAALVDHNIPLAAADTFSPLSQKMFPDSEIAKSFATTPTKTPV